MWSVAVRPTDHQKRADIAEKAFEVLLERGVHKTSMSQLAKALEMKRPTLYWYFPTLDTLFEMVTARIEERLLQQVAVAMAAERHPLDQLIAILNTTTAYYEREQRALRGLVQMWTMRQQDTTLIGQRVVVQRAFLSELVRQGVRDGIVAPCDPEALIETVLTVLDGAVFRRVVAGTNPSIPVQFLITQVLEPLRLSPKGTQS
jgi:TetR/AcrR family transcriptional regulator